MPPTERKGRVHTSTVTVAVIDPTLKPLDFNESEIRVEWFSGTGAGGQNRNKVKNSCRIIHIQTGLTSTSQTRDRTTSYKNAIDDMKTKIEEYRRQESAGKVSDLRKLQVGSGMRGDKIRTIRFQDDSAIDHRNGRRMTAKQYLQGGMDRLWD